MSRVATLWVWAVFAFMYLPIAVIALFSVNDSKIMSLPFSGFTLGWYGQVLSDGRLGGGFLTTLTVAVPVAIAATLLGALAALALSFYPMRGRGLFTVLLLAPFLIPKLILAVAQLILFSETGVPRSLLTVIGAQTLIVLPFSTLVIASVLIRIDRGLIEAAEDLGASGFSAFRRVVLPLMANGLLASWVVAFVLSTSEYVLTAFVSGRAQPLSVLVASDFRFALSPALNALAVMIVFGNIALVALAELIRHRAARGEG